MKNLILKSINTLLYAFVLSFALVALGSNPAVALVASIVIVELASLVAPKGILGANAYADTVLQTARAFIKDPNNKKFQLRPEFTRIMEIFMKDREFTIPNLAALRSSTTQATEAMYLKKKDFTIGTDKTCSPTGETSGSAKVALTWASKTVEIRTSFKQHAGNEVAQARAFANDLYNAEVSLFFGASGLDAALLAVLDVNKSGVNAGGSGNFDAVNDIMAIDPANVDDFYNLVTADMMKNNFNPTFLEAHDTMWTAKQRRFVNQGAGNNTNLAFQFAGFEFYASNLIAPGVIGPNTYTSIHYIVPDQGVALLDWNDPQNVAGKVSGEKSWSTYQSLLVPGITLDLFRTTTCTDTTADGGGKQDIVEVWELTLNYATAVQPTATGTPIFKYGTLNATYIP